MLNGFSVVLIVCCVCVLHWPRKYYLSRHKLAGQTCDFVSRTDENRCIVMIDVIESERSIAT